MKTYVHVQIEKVGDIRGIYSIIQSSVGPSKAESERYPFEKIPIYKSNERTLCQKMCEWGFESASQLDEKISQ
jgi:hypothetical protein